MKRFLEVCYCETRCPWFILQLINEGKEIGFRCDKSLYRNAMVGARSYERGWEGGFLGRVETAPFSPSHFDDISCPRRQMMNSMNEEKNRVRINSDICKSCQHFVVTPRDLNKFDDFFYGCRMLGGFIVTNPESLDAFDVPKRCVRYLEHVVLGQEKS